MEEKLWKRPTGHSMFVSRSKSKDDGLRASYNISKQSGKPHIMGDLLI